MSDLDGQVELPPSVYYVNSGVVSAADSLLEFRVFETLVEAEAYREVVSAFYSKVPAIRGVPLGEVLASIKKAKRPTRLPFSRYDGLGQLIDAEVLFDPHLSIH